MTCASKSYLAVAVIQSIPIFDETKLFSIPVPRAVGASVGASVSFSYFLHVYLVLMFLGEHSKVQVNIKIF